MNIQIEGSRAYTTSAFDNKLLSIIGRLEGSRKFLVGGAYSFEATAHNIAVWNETFPDSEINGKLPSFAQPVSKAAPSKVKFSFKTVPYPGQLKAFEKGKDLNAFALFMEMGTGKSKVNLDIAAYRFLAKRIRAVLIIAPKGVHEQWIEKHIPTHLPEGISWTGAAWNNKLIPKAVLEVKPSRLAFFTINPDAIWRDKGALAVDLFIDAYDGKVLLILDESHLFKKKSTKRTKAVISIGARCSDRMINSGTPIARDVTDLYSQFYFLNPSIIGHRYVTSFRSEYCVMGGYMGRQVVGSKNLDRLYRKIDPNVFRMTKEELGLPEKRKMEHHFTISDEQRKIMRSLKELWMTEFEDPKVALSVSNAAVLIGRLQQVSCGYVPLDDGSVRLLDTNPRMEALRDVLSETSGKTVIWARFNQDIELIAKELGESGEYEQGAVTYYGPTSPKDRKAAIASFIGDPSVRFFIASPAAAGTGTDGLQSVTENVIYYSQSFNAVERWQSEDRTHRIGSKISTLYVDLVGRGTPDVRISRNLQAKKSLSDMTLDDIRKMIEEE